MAYGYFEVVLTLPPTGGVSQFLSFYGIDTGLSKIPARDLALEDEGTASFLESIEFRIDGSADYTHFEAFQWGRETPNGLARNAYISTPANNALSLIWEWRWLEAMVDEEGPPPDPSQLVGEAPGVFGEYDFNNGDPEYHPITVPSATGGEAGFQIYYYPDTWDGERLLFYQETWTQPTESIVEFPVNFTIVFPPIVDPGEPDIEEEELNVWTTLRNTRHRRIAKVRA